MKVRYLLDENLSPRLKSAVLRSHPAIDILRVGDDGAPDFGTLDPDILRYLQAARRILATDNRASIPNHIRDHYAEGGFHWGIVWVRPDSTIQERAETLYLIWEIEDADE